ncbi:flagellar hook-basal body complex protein FliE [Bermanella marisrubri]|uniref:Flagellar hook-basal body complex protein FliE n=1 Tax=Bermanella marisrubri TaxID=207949 RepID=Q1N2X5_9GAMM|nr:flagellar hook-basal body complex protein FliE [Bermanella marisrubri]EAT12544.1 flagellar hook-basal body complex protein (FliE) [Oceanobacter sp. RED65] [Bermanella marisrubri]QIZ84898.1 flagellar hook-basal body complex protein FliE [Bermanella marisrubri]
MVDRADINSVLSQLRQVREQVQSAESTPVKLTGPDHLNKEVDKVQKVSENYPDIKPDPNTPDFQTMFANAINGVRDKQAVSSDLKQRFERGDPMVDLPEVMIAAQKASVSFDAMKEVRNKLVEAYKDIMNMPV